ncbi:hypothetical protein B0H16DRAFT_1535925 [Mycena metata]|uniref:Uncharacterized protein n=1 Tax=Mycena metata TaxID=1033252 RepID=A0AAD7J6S1_9AGAR|nr:hypothetical protein B0H16DRAFT_1535925 [Mycena metata]
MELQAANNAPNEPRLPPDLERSVFEAAASSPSGMLNLMLVAWRVKVWIEPLLYRVIFLSTYPSEDHPVLDGLPVFTVDVLRGLIAVRGPAFFQGVVHHLFLDGASDIPDRDVPTILEACRHVTNLHARFGYGPLPSLDEMPRLQRLAIDTRPLFGRKAAVDFSRALFRNLTHLELLGNTYHESSTLEFHNIPHLTHIAFNSSVDTGLQNRLRTDTRLLCIVYLASHEGHVNDKWALLDDSRFVRIVQETNYWLDWVRGARSGKDYWAAADEFIAARRAGKIDQPPYLIIVADFSWRAGRKCAYQLWEGIFAK